MENNIVFMIGQELEMNCGAMFPTQRGHIIGFDKTPASKLFPEKLCAVVRWNGYDESPAYNELVELEQIHPQGWRSANRSAIGVFVK